MSVQLPELTKRYYTTGEVAQLFGLTRATIRYWEEKFSLLQAHKFGNGERRFRADQVQLIHQIYVLVKERGFTLQGAEQELNAHKTWYRQKDSILEKLRKVKTGLEEMRLNM